MSVCLLTLLRFHQRLVLTRSARGRFLLLGRWGERRDILLPRLIPGPVTSQCVKLCCWVLGYRGSYPRDHEPNATAAAGDQRNAVFDIEQPESVKRHFDCSKSSNYKVSTTRSQQYLSSRTKAEKSVGLSDPPNSHNSHDNPNSHSKTDHTSAMYQGTWNCYSILLPKAWNHSL